MSAASDVLAEVAAGGLRVKILDLSWNPGDHISECQSDYILCYRTFPCDVEMEVTLGGRASNKFGRLLFCPADVELSTTAAGGRNKSRHITCFFSVDWFQRVSAFDWHAADIARCLNMRNPRIEQSVQRLGLEVANPGFASPLLTESLAAVVAVEVARHFHDDGSTFRTRTRDGVLSQADIGRIYEYIDSVADGCPSADDIAVQCNISAAHLRRSFKRTTGQTIHRYVEDVRLERAKVLLASTDLPLKIISHRLGFADSSTFSYAFRRTSGETPGGYRQRTRQ